jgi:phage terminase small subunit
MADNYELFLTCKDVIQKEGITYTNKKTGKKEKHPLLKTQTDA